MKNKHFLENFFSVINKNEYKILTILGVEIKFKSKYNALKLENNALWKKIELTNLYYNFSPFIMDNVPILTVLKNLGEFTYIPNRGNMGDMLIASATLQFFDENKLQYKMFDGSAADSVVYGGGGIWTKDYEPDWQRFLPVFAAAEHVVILPSSFNNCQKLVDALDERFVVFCREKKSYDYLTAQNTKAAIILDHDMSFRMTEIILHSDVEVKYYEREIIKNVAVKLREIPRTVKFIRKDSESAGNYETDIDLSSYVFGDEYATRGYIDFCAKLMLVAVDSADKIITDRLHVVIAGALMGKEVYFLDNSYGKLSGVYKHSMKDNPRIHFVLEIPQELSDKIYAKNQN